MTFMFNVLLLLLSLLICGCLCQDRWLDIEVLSSTCSKTSYTCRGSTCDANSKKCEDYYIQVCSTNTSELSECKNPPQDNKCLKENGTGGFILEMHFGVGSRHAYEYKNILQANNQFFIRIYESNNWTQFNRPIAINCQTAKSGGIITTQSPLHDYTLIFRVIEVILLTTTETASVFTNDLISKVPTSTISSLLTSTSGRNRQSLDITSTSGSRLLPVNTINSFINKTNLKDSTDDDVSSWMIVRIVQGVAFVIIVIGFTAFCIYCNICKCTRRIKPSSTESGTEISTITNQTHVNYLSESSVGRNDAQCQRQTQWSGTSLVTTSPVLNGTDNLTIIRGATGNNLMVTVNQIRNALTPGRSQTSGIQDDSDNITVIEGATGCQSPVTEDPTNRAQTPRPARRNLSPVRRASKITRKTKEREIKKKEG